MEFGLDIEALSEQIFVFILTTNPYYFVSIVSSFTVKVTFLFHLQQNLF